MRSLSKSIIILVVLGSILFPSEAYMQRYFVVCDDPPSSSDHWALGCSLANLLTVPVRIFNYLLSGAALVLLLMIVWAGVRMAMYWFNEQPEQELVAAKLTLTRGIVGFVMVATAMLIINILAVTILGLDYGYPIREWIGNLIYFR